MAEKVQLEAPDYKKIYFDIVHENFPHMLEEVQLFFSKRDELSTIDVVMVNKLIFGSLEHDKNPKLKAYGKKDIFNILLTQKKLGLNNTEISRKFKISRNTLAKWKRNYFSNIEM